MKSKSGSFGNKNRGFSYIKWLIAFLLFVSSLMLMYTVSWVDDVPWYDELDKTTVAFQDLNGVYKSEMSDAGIHVVCKEEVRVISSRIDLDHGTAIRARLHIKNNANGVASIYIDLYDGESNYDQAGMQACVSLQPGTNEKEVILPFGRTKHPASCQLRIISYQPNDLTYESVEVAHLEKMVGGSKVVLAVEIMSCIVALVSALYFGYETQSAYQAGYITKELLNLSGKFNWLNAKMFLAVNLIVLVWLWICYRAISLELPLGVSGGDEFGVYYYAKLIDEFGITLVNFKSGGVWGAEMYDYPYADTFSFGFVKVLGLFTDNPFLIINLFYFSCFFLASNICLVSMLYLGVDRVAAVVLSCLYGFTPYITIRYGHMWLVPFFMMPVACVVALDIVKGKYFETVGGERTRYYSIMLFLSFCCAFTGLYYAYFASALICAAWLITFLNRGEKKARDFLYVGGYLLAIIFPVFVQTIPNMLYVMLHGVNSSSEMAMRTGYDAEYYALKLVNLLLPRLGHRIGWLRDIAAKYASTYPLVNENQMASLGIVGSIGFLVSMGLLFKRKNQYAAISNLMLSTMLIATIGGISSVISVLIKLPVRAYNRMSVIIMFLALLQVGYCLEKIRARILIKKYLLVTTLILLVGLYDQTITQGRIDYTQFYATKEFVANIERNLEDGDFVFILPFHRWPSGGYYRTFYGYILSEKNIRWSYGAAQGREESNWQEGVANATVSAMVDELKQAGYTGLYFDSYLYNAVYRGALARGTMESAADYVNKITEVLGAPDVVSSYHDLYFWKL